VYAINSKLEHNNGNSIFVCYFFWSEVIMENLVLILINNLTLKNILIFSFNFFIVH